VRFTANNGQVIITKIILKGEF